MSTRSTIALLRQDGTVSQVYCHSDGYLGHNGQMLFLNYQDPKKIEKIMALGDMSYLQPEVDIPPGAKHSFEYNERAPGVSVFYGRDRGETGIEARQFKSLQDYKENGDFEEFDYIFKESNATWYLYLDDAARMSKLTTQFKKDADECAQALAHMKAEKEKNFLDKEIKTSDKPAKETKLKI